jgi:hypothetical protein
MNKAHKWMTDLMAANDKGFSPTWVPPVISWVVSGKHVGAPPPPVPRALPPGTPAPVTMENDPPVSRRRVRCKRPPSQVLAPTGQRIRASQRDQNLAMPSAVQQVGGAPPPMVSESGAPDNVLCPPADETAVPGVRNNLADWNRLEQRRRPHADDRCPPAVDGTMTNRMQKRLLRMANEPPLGCSRCRRSPVGCESCKRTRRGWLILHKRGV